MVRGSNFIEAGVTVGEDSYNNNTPRYFVGNAPGSNANEYFYPSGPGLNNNFGVDIHYIGSSNYSLNVGGNQSTFYGIMSAPDNRIQVGTETDSNGSHARGGAYWMTYYPTSGGTHLGWSDSSSTAYLFPQGSGYASWINTYTSINDGSDC